MEIFSSREHKRQAAKQDPVPVAIVTMSDTRTKDNDVNGQYLRDEIIKSGDEVVEYYVVKDEAESINKVLEELRSSQARVVIFNGGTGIASRDRTYDVLSGKFTKTLPGFGEIFRMLSYREIGAAAMLSRATAGVYDNRVIISIPGSPQAVRLAWEKLIAPELKHLAWELTR